MIILKRTSLQRSKAVHAIAEVMNLNQEPLSGTETVNLGIRVHLWYGTILLFREQIAPSYTRVVGSRMGIVTFRDQMVRV